MEMIAGGGVMHSWAASIEMRSDVLLMSYTGLVLQRKVHEQWVARGGAETVTVFDLRRATTLYTGPGDASMLQAQQRAPAAIVCSPTDYAMFSQRVSTLDALGVRRALFCSLALALEWAAMQGPLARARSTTHRHGQPVLARHAL